MIKKRDIKEYIEDNGNPFSESKIDFLKGFRMGQQFQKTDLLEAIKLEMDNNAIAWKNYEDDPDQVKAFNRRLEFLDFMQQWIKHNL
jgi:hypothetical protein